MLYRFIEVRSRRYVAAVAAVCTLAVSSLIQATIIPPANDDWQTLSASVEFGSTAIPTIPTNFFGPGSQPFDGVIDLLGVPIDPVNSTGDTIIARLAPLNLPTIGSNDTVPIELVALNLVSINPIDVGGGNFWDVFVSVQPAPASAGALTATKTHENGGTYDIAIPAVHLKVTFQPVGGGSELELTPTSAVDLANPVPVGWKVPPGPHAPAGAVWASGTTLGPPWTPVTINGMTQTVKPAKIPEPATLTMLALGGLAVLVRRRPA